MKILIRSAAKSKYPKIVTEKEIVDDIVNKFESAGCTGVVAGEPQKNHCEISLILPNRNNYTTITVWYDYEKVEHGHNSVEDKVPWDPSFSVDSSGAVYDDSGERIGHVKVIRDKRKLGSPRYVRDYSVPKIRTDSGDVIVDHPESVEDYKKVVKQLENRKIEHRS